MGPFPMTLTRFIIERPAAHPGVPGEFSALMAQVGLIGKMIAGDLRRAGLINIFGTTGATNVQGEAVKKLDEIANETFVNVLQHSGLVCVVGSEEMEKPLHLPQNWPQGKYMLLFDPLDGSSNTDVNMPLGSIFSILRYDEKAGQGVEAALIRRGTEQVAAGYVMYGSSTMLVYTSGQGVHGFTLDPEVGEYVLSHQDIRMPMHGNVYAVNEGNYGKWTSGVQRFVDDLKAQDKAKGRPYASRYSGCLAADVHRILLGGGVYLYPGEKGKPEGKLRLLYEANPLALLVHQAGGLASTGSTPILEVEPTSLHQRVPLMIGSRDEVLLGEQFVREEARG